MELGNLIKSLLKPRKISLLSKIASIVTVIGLSLDPMAIVKAAMVTVLFVCFYLALDNTLGKKMPVGTVARNAERFELKTLPEAYVVVRRMSYGEKLERQDEILSMRTQKGSDGLDISMMNKKAALRDFGRLVVEHNITDESERVLNFKDAKDVVALDPRVGEEIGNYIDSINSYEELPEIKN